MKQNTFNLIFNIIILLLINNIIALSMCGNNDTILQTQSMISKMFGIGNDYIITENIIEDINDGNIIYTYNYTLYDGKSYFNHVHNKKLVFDGRKDFGIFAMEYGEGPYTPQNKPLVKEQFFHLKDISKFSNKEWDDMKITVNLAKFGYTGNITEFGRIFKLQVIEDVYVVYIGHVYVLTESKYYGRETGDMTIVMFTQNEGVEVATPIFIHEVVYKNTDNFDKSSCGNMDISNGFALISSPKKRDKEFTAILRNIIMFKVTKNMSPLNPMPINISEGFPIPAESIRHTKLGTGCSICEDVVAYSDPSYSAGVAYVGINPDVLNNKWEVYTKLSPRLSWGNYQEFGKILKLTKNKLYVAAPNAWIYYKTDSKPQIGVVYEYERKEDGYEASKYYYINHIKNDDYIHSEISFMERIGDDVYVTLTNDNNVYKLKCDESIEVN